MILNLSSYKISWNILTATETLNLSQHINLYLFDSILSVK